MMKIAVRIPNWIGDAVLSTPFVSAIRQVFPDAEIFLIMRDAVRDVYEGNPWSDRTIIINDRKDGPIPTGLNLQRYRFDHYFNLPGSFSSGLISLLSGAEERHGFTSEGGSFFFQDRIKSSGLKGLHRARRYLELLRHFPVKKQTLEARVFLEQKEIQRAKSLLKKLKLKRIVIGMNPNCSAIARRWPREKFAELADRLLEKVNNSVIFFGSPGETEYVQAVAGMMKHQAIDLSGKINLREYTAILSLIRIFITNDS
ncbi:MAG: glycosyltransferase family 9 protein, partial [bacterium]|nr:glycosyltransferase family 9 protein [bacterium]